MIDALCDRGHTPYRQIGHRAVSYVMDRCGISYTQDEVEWLVAQIESLKPFPDVLEALGRLRGAGYGLAILSNGDRDMLKAAGPHIGFPFDHVISVQERSEEHTSDLQSLMRISYAVFCLKKKIKK